MIKLSHLTRFSVALIFTMCGSFALALEAKVNGVISQGFIKTWGNNYFGDSSDSSGSFEFRETALYGQLLTGSALSISGQLLARDAGATDNDDIRVDYFFADWRGIDKSSHSLGVRLGRVRNEIGFYNQTRDIVFARPSVLLPQSVYLEAAGLRELLFSSDAAQFYGDFRYLNSSTSASLTIGRDSDLSKEALRNLLGNPSVDSELKIESPIIANIETEFGGGRWRAGLSYAQTDLFVEENLAKFVPQVDASAQLAILSLQANFENTKITAEISALEIEAELLGLNLNSATEGAYLQLEHRLNARWELVIRQEISHADRRQRNRTQNRDIMVGIRWEPTESWLFAAEFHHIDGANNFPEIDNHSNTPLEEQSNLFALIGAYRF